MLFFRPLKVLYTHLPNHTHTHLYTDGGGCYAECQNVYQEHFRLKYLDQGHVDMRTGGAGNPTSGLPISERPTLKPEPEPDIPSKSVPRGMGANEKWQLAFKPPVCLCMDQEVVGEVMALQALGVNLAKLAAAVR